MERNLIIPGEVIAKGKEFLPGEWTEKRNDEIVVRFGVAEEQDKLVKVIPISGPFQPRRGNAVIGQVVNIMSSGWFVDIDTPENAFLPVSEFPRYVNKGELGDVLELGSVVVAKIINIDKRGIDLTLRDRGGLGKVENGIVIKVNSNKVPRIIGKEGSMVNLIKEETGCDITVGQNGVIWISGENTERELLAKEAIMFITERFFLEGLTEEVKSWFERKRK